MGTVRCDAFSQSSNLLLHHHRRPQLKPNFDAFVHLAAVSRLSVTNATHSQQLSCAAGYEFGRISGRSFEGFARGGLGDRRGIEHAVVVAAAAAGAAAFV